MKIKAVLVLVVLVLSIKAKCQFLYNSNIEELHKNVLALNISDLSTIELNSESEGLQLWLIGYNFFLQKQFGNSELTNHQLINKLHYYLKELEDLTNTSPFYQFCLAELNLYLSYTYLQSGKYYYSGKRIYKAYKLINKNKIEYPNFDHNIRHALILQSIDYLLSNNIPFLSRITEQTNDSVINNEVMTIVNKSACNSVFTDEILLFGLFLNRNILRSERYSDEIISKLDSNWVNKGPLHLLVVLQSEPKNIPNKAELLFNKAKGNGYLNQCSRLSYIYGDYLLNKRDSNCVYYLNKYLKNKSGCENESMAHLKLMWHYFLVSDTVNYKKKLIDISKCEPKSEIDKHAFNEFENRHNWDKTILNARLLFDGGYLEKSLNKILEVENSINTFSEEKQIEYYYRLARIYDALGNVTNAVINYRKVLEVGLDKSFYYSSYASYYLGELYLKTHEINLAIEYFNKSLSLKSPVYESAIHNKAQQALNKCKK